MKKTRLLFLAMMAMVIAFSGCSKDDDFSIVGTWQQEAFEMTVNFGFGEDMVIDEDEGEDITITFNADGTGSATDSDGTDTFTWNLSGDVLTISDNEMNLSLNLTTKTDTRLVGEQILTKDEMVEMFEMGEEEMEMFETFPNLTAKLKIILVR